MKKLFTLIELIVVIAVLGILAAIIIPNISSFQEEAKNSAVASNIKTLQTSVDMHTLDSYGNYPTQEQPTKSKPQPIDFTQLHPDKVRGLPKTEGVNYWVDYQGKIWASSIDAPTGVEYDTINLKWNRVDNAAYYNVFKETSSQTTSSVKDNTLIFVKKVESSSDIVSISISSLKDNETYLVSAVDNVGFESPPVGDDYTGFQNQAPKAVITVSPEQNINTDTTLSWSYQNSLDPDLDDIINAEWKVNDTTVSSPPTSFPTMGNYTVELRVQDTKGNWSEWVQKDLNVEKSVYTSCKDVLNYNANATSRTYNIQLSENESPLEIYCDMETDGGGWMVFGKEGSWNFSGTENFTLTLFSSNDLSTLRKVSFTEYKVDTDVNFSLREDDSNNTSIVYIANILNNFSTDYMTFKDGYYNDSSTLKWVTSDSSKITCVGNSGYNSCGQSYGTPSLNQSTQPLIVYQLNATPTTNGSSAHNNQWTRNNTIFNGTYYKIMLR